MLNKETVSTLVRELAVQAPMLFASVVGLLIAFRFRRRAPRASLWTAGAFSLSLFICGLIVFSSVTQNAVVSYLITPYIRAITYLLLLAGVYTGRKDQNLLSTGSSAPIWQPLITSIRSVKTVILVVSIGMFLVVMLTGSLVTAFLPDIYSSKARVKLERLIPDRANSSQTALKVVNAGMVNNQCEVIRSDIVLEQVLERLRLNEVWGRRNKSGQPLTSSQTRQKLLASLEVAAVADTSIIEVKYADESPRVAADIANAVVRVYKNYFATAPPDVSNSPRLYVEVIEAAEPGKRPIKPNRALNILVTMWTGFWLSLITMVGAACFTLMVARRDRGARLQPPAIPNISSI